MTTTRDETAGEVRERVARAIADADQAFKGRPPLTDQEWRNYWSPGGPVALPSSFAMRADAAIAALRPTPPDLAAAYERAAGPDVAKHFPNGPWWQPDGTYHGSCECGTAFDGHDFKAAVHAWGDHVATALSQPNSIGGSGTGEVCEHGHSDPMSLCTQCEAREIDGSAD